MHDHDHDHQVTTTRDHDFGELTSSELMLLYRSQLLHVATEIFTAGVPSGRAATMASYEHPYYDPKEAVEVAQQIIAQVDDVIIKSRRAVEES